MGDKNPEEVRKKLNEMNAMMKVAGQGLPEAEIETIVTLHCDEGYTLEEGVDILLNKH